MTALERRFADRLAPFFANSTPGNCAAVVKVKDKRTQEIRMHHIYKACMKCGEDLPGSVEALRLLKERKIGRHQLNTYFCKKCDVEFTLLVLRYLLKCSNKDYPKLERVLMDYYSGYRRAKL